VRELYVYYRVPSTAVARVERELIELQAVLRASHPGLRARWLRRPAEPGEAQTWMETYAVDPAVAPAGVDAALEQAIESAAAQRLTGIEGPRHVEVFLACAS
jgi:hypothetical protein